MSTIQKEHERASASRSVPQHLAPGASIQNSPLATDPYPKELQQYTPYTMPTLSRHPKPKSKTGENQINKRVFWRNPLPVARILRASSLEIWSAQFDNCINSLTQGDSQLITSSPPTTILPPRAPTQIYESGWFICQNWLYRSLMSQNSSTVSYPPRLGAATQNISTEGPLAPLAPQKSLLLRIL